MRARVQRQPRQRVVALQHVPQHVRGGLRVQRVGGLVAALGEGRVVVGAVHRVQVQRGLEEGGAGVPQVRAARPPPGGHAGQRRRGHGVAERERLLQHGAHALLAAVVPQALLREVRRGAGGVVVGAARAAGRPHVVEHVAVEQLVDVLPVLVVDVEQHHVAVLAVREGLLEGHRSGLRGGRGGKHKDVRGGDVARRVQVRLDGGLGEAFVGREAVGHEAQARVGLGGHQAGRQHARSPRAAAAAQVFQRSRHLIQVLSR